MKGRNNPWLSPELSSLLKPRDDAWAKARKSKSQDDWQILKQLRNRFTSLVKKAKSNFNVEKTTRNLNNPKKFWQVVNSSFGDKTTDELPACIVKDAHTLVDKTTILYYFNEHFVLQDLYLSPHIHINLMCYGFAFNQHLLMLWLQDLI